MKQPNPFNSAQTPQDRLNQSRTRLRLAVFGALALCLLVLVPLLVQGCKREQPPTPPDSGFPPMVTDTNLPPAEATHSNISLPPLVFPTPTNPPVTGGVAPGLTPTPEVVAPAATGGEYTVQKGDSFYTIGKKHGVSVKAMTAANPGVDSTKLKIGQKLVLPAPAPAAATPTATAPGTAVADVGGEKTYTVKSGDTLTRIAKSQGASVKAIKSANNLTTDRIKVGQKLKIPGKAAATAAPAPVTATELAPVIVPPTAPETTPGLPPLTAPK